MAVNDIDRNFKKPQRRNQRLVRSRKSPAHSSVQAQPASDASVGTETNPRDQFDPALINCGHFTAAANATVNHRNMTINIQAMEGVTPQPQNLRQTPNHGRDRRTVLMPDPPGPVQRSNEIYERYLRLKKRGYPLWIPQSNMVLPIPYRAQGAHVGDVGIFTENGGFDFLFNICVPRDDPINPRRLPENFIPISPPVDPTDIRKFAEFIPGSYLASSSVAESRTDESSDLIFESSASEGAILTMPEGAYSEDLNNCSRIGQYIATHAEDWYKFVNGPRGREAQNGDLRVVIGSDKTTSWGMATFSNSILSQETKLRLKFSALGEQQSQRNAGNKYIWEHSGVASVEVRIGPGRGENEELGETNSNRLRNQCLFIRTLNVTLSEKVWEEMFSHPVALADQNRLLGIQNQPTCSPHAINTRHSHPQPSELNSFQNLPFRSHNSTNSPISLNHLVPPTPMSPPESFDSFPATDCFTDMFLQDVKNTSKMKCVAINEEIQCDSTPTPDVILTCSSSCNSVLHPSKIVNQCLLKHVPHARVAVTHDRDWSSIVGMVSCHSDPSQLFSVVCSMTDIVLDNDTGLICLELKEKNENRVSSEEAKVAELIESIKDGRLRLDQYLFGLHDDRCLRLQDLRDMLRSGSTNQPIPMDSFLSAHPERPLSLDELLNVFEGGHLVHGSIHRESITSLRAKLSLLPTRHADQSSLFLRLGDALLRRFSQWAQKDDLEEAIWCYEEALSLVPNSHYYYLEALLGLCSSLYQRYYLLGHADDLKNLLLHLDLQCDVFNRQRSLLAPVEVQLCGDVPGTRYHGYCEEVPGTV